MDKRVVCKEVFEVLKNSDVMVIEKVPIELIVALKKNMNNDYEVNIDTKKDLLEQNISDESKILLSSIYIKYLCDKERREAIENKIEEVRTSLKSTQNKVEKEVKNDNKENNEKSCMNLIEIKSESMFKKILNKIYKLLKIKK